MSQPVHIDGWRVVPVSRGQIRWKPWSWGVQLQETIYGDQDGFVGPATVEILLPWKTIDQILVDRRG